MFSKSMSFLRPVKLSKKPELVPFEELKWQFLEYLNLFRMHYMSFVYQNEKYKDDKKVRVELQDMISAINAVEDDIKVFIECEDFVQFKAALKDREDYPHQPQMSQALGKLLGTVSHSVKIIVPDYAGDPKDNLFFAEESFIRLAGKFAAQPAIQSAEKVVEKKAEVKSDATKFKNTAKKKTDAFEVGMLFFKDFQQEELCAIKDVFIQYLQSAQRYYQDYSKLRDRDAISALRYVKDAVHLIEKFSDCSTLSKFQSAITSMMSNAISNKASFALSLLSGKCQDDDSQSFLLMIKDKNKKIKITSFFDQSLDPSAELVALHNKFLKLAVNFFENYREELTLRLDPALVKKLKHEKEQQEKEWLPKASDLSSDELPLAEFIGLKI